MTETTSQVTITAEGELVTPPLGRFHRMLKAPYFNVALIAIPLLPALLVDGKES